jgi:hypothetical protein
MTGCFVSRELWLRMASLAWIVGTLAWSALAARPAPAAQPNARFAKPLEMPALENEELVAAPLDSDVYAATGEQFSDLRLLDAAGHEVAYVLRKAATKRSRVEQRRFPVEKPTVHPRDDGGLEITFEIDLKKHPKPPQGFTLVTPLRNFERRVQISASTDGETWTPLVTDGLVFDYSQFMDVHNRDLPLPTEAPAPAEGADAAGAAPGRYRIVIDDVTQELQSQLLELTRHLQGDDETSRTERVVVDRQPFRIDRIEAWYDVDVVDSRVEVEKAYPLAGFRLEQDADAKATYVYVDARREPLTKLTIETGDRNFSRAAHVEVEGTAAPQKAKRDWRRTLGSATLSRLDFRSLRREDLSIALPQSRESRYRVVIENRDSPPLAITGVAGRGSVYEVVFLAKSGEQYRLAYGDETAAAPAYDTAALAASLAEGYEPLVATLGEQVALAAAPDAPPQRLVQLLNDPRFLGGGIALLVVILGVGLYRATRRLDNLPRDADSSD